MPLNVTVLVPSVAPKFAPVIVTAVPTGPDVGRERRDRRRDRHREREPLLASPPTVTTTLPGRRAARHRDDDARRAPRVGVAAVPLNVTVLVPAVAPKFAPVIVTASSRPARGRTERS